VSEYSYLTNRELFRVAENRPDLTPLEIELLNRIIKDNVRPTHTGKDLFNAGWPHVLHPN